MILRVTGFDSTSGPIPGNIEHCVKVDFGRPIQYGSLQSLAAAEISREQAARTIGELKPENAVTLPNRDTVTLPHR